MRCSRRRSEPGLPSELLLRRPDVAEAEANLASAHANVDAARAAFPAADFAHRLGRLCLHRHGHCCCRVPISATPMAPACCRPFSMAASWPARRIWPTRPSRNSSPHYQSAALNAYSDVETALIQVANNRKAEDHLRREVEAAQEAFEISELQYRQGAADLLNVLQAQQTVVRRGRSVGPDDPGQPAGLGPSL